MLFCDNKELQVPTSSTETTNKMAFKNKTNILISLLMLIALLLACTGYETDKANKSVDEANKSVDEGNAALKDANAKNDKMIDAEAAIKEESEVEGVKTQAKETVAAYEKASKAYNNASMKFDEASKFNVQDKFKEYLQAKSQEMKKRSEMCDAAKGIGQALIDSKSQVSSKIKLKA
jgi:hypothetical protein